MSPTRLLVLLALCCVILANVGCGSKRSEEPQIVDTPVKQAERTQFAEIVEIDDVPVLRTGDTTEDEALRAAVASRQGFEGKVNIAYPDGTPEIDASYTDGVKDGKWVKYHGNGQVFEQGEYVGGEKHGQWLTFYPSGNKLEEASYQNGRPIGMYRAWLEDGTLIVEKDMSRGLN